MLNTGGTIDCSAHGVPVPEITWHSLSGGTNDLSHRWRPLRPNPSPTYESQISPLFRVLTHNNSLSFRAFSPSEFQHHVHDAFYRCQARSESGVALSRRVRVRAGKYHLILNHTKK